MAEIIEDVVHDCDFMKNRLPDHCADLIIADPPCFRYKGDFDFVWPTFDDYRNDVRRWGEECRRLLKDNGTLIGWGSDKRIAYSQVILDELFTFLNSGVWLKTNGPGAYSNKDVRRKFFPSYDRFLLYESRPEIREGEARKISDIFKYEQGMCRTRCMKPLVDYLTSEMERAGFTPNRINEALHTCMAGHWFTRGSQWELPTRENYERLRSLFNGNRPDGEFPSKDYEELRRPFNLPERSADVLVRDSGASKRYGKSYLASFLHQTTTKCMKTGVSFRCFLFLFYIKPQRQRIVTGIAFVVSYSFSTSNHNTWTPTNADGEVVSYSFSTSNHNSAPHRVGGICVVSYSFSTSNHNKNCG